MIYPFPSLPENLAAFCAMLRHDYRFRVGPRELQDAARALEMADLADEHGVRNVLRPVLAGKIEEARVFDQAFSRFFGPAQAVAPADGIPSGPDAVRGDPDRQAREGDDSDRSPPSDSAGQESTAEGDARGAVRDVREAGEETGAGLLRASYSPLESEGTAPVLEPTDRDWRDAAAMLVNRVRAGLSRRWRPARRGQRFDLRRTLRTSLHTGGDVVVPRWRARPRRRPRFVVLIDGSRSMEPHAKAVLQMAVALTSVTLNAETFTFSTALRRVTRDVRRAAAGEPRRLKLHYAWGGGTTIGACLRQFLHLHGERLLGRDTVVIIASDGLDVGDPHMLREGMARLFRFSAAVVWLNPLLDTRGYEPIALGMSTARPYVTTFVSVNDPEGLVQLAHVIRVR